MAFLYCLTDFQPYWKLAHGFYKSDSIFLGKTKVKSPI